MNANELVGLVAVAVHVWTAIRSAGVLDGLTLRLCGLEGL